MITSLNKNSQKRLSTVIKIYILKKIDESTDISKIAQSMQLPKSYCFQQQNGKIPNEGIRFCL